MTSYALAALLLCASPGWDSGSLIVLQDSNKPVERFTGSNITHVALLVHVGGNPWVYEATPAKVRCVPLDTYRTELGELNSRRSKQTRMWLLEPKRPYTDRQLLRMKAFLDSQVGRRYSVKGYVRGKRSDGVHCAEFASLALARSERHSFEKNYSISPASFVRQLAPAHQQAVKVRLSAPASQDSWCSRSWRQWYHFHTWCSWACYEAWTFCW